MFTPDMNEGSSTTPVRVKNTTWPNPSNTVKGSPYYQKYVAVMESNNDNVTPDNNFGNYPPAGRYTYYHSPIGAAPVQQTGPMTGGGTVTTQSSISSAVDAGLNKDHVFGRPQYGNLDPSYTIGNIVHVDSQDPAFPSYELVELVESGTTVALALVNDDQAGGYWFGALDGVTGGARLPTKAALNAQVAQAGLHGSARVEWGPTVEGASPFAPFVVGNDGNGAPAVAGARSNAIPLFALK